MRRAAISLCLQTVSYFVITESKLEYIGYLYNWYDF